MVVSMGKIEEESLNLDPEPVVARKKPKLTKAQRSSEFILKHSESFREIKPRPITGERGIEIEP